MPEALLRKYRPVGPPPRLRARLVEGDARAWPWAAAAAALLAMGVGLHAATRAGADATSVGIDLGITIEDRVRYLTQMMGGSEEARRLAVLRVSREETLMRLSTPEPPLAEPPR